MPRCIREAIVARGDRCVAQFNGEERAEALVVMIKLSHVALRTLMLLLCVHGGSLPSPAGFPASL